MIPLGLFLSLALPVFGAPAGLDDHDQRTLAAMQAELGRSSTELRLENRPPPYFVSYWVVDGWQYDVQGTLGTIVGTDYTEGRRVRTEVRVGNSELDNSNFMGSGFEALAGVHGAGAPTPSPRRDPGALRHFLWLTTDAAYKKGVETLEQRRASRERELATEDEAPSFSLHERTEQFESAGDPVKRDTRLDDYVRRISNVFRAYPDIQRSWVHLVVSTERRYFTSSEGSAIVVNTPYTELEVHCETQAGDGMSLERSSRLASVTVAPPDESEALSAAKRIAEELVALREARVLEDYSGPVLFEGRAAAQIAHELLAESLSGTPPPRGAEGLESPLARRVGKRIMPRTFSVFDDPGLTEYAGHRLVGHYAVDDEGVLPKRVVLVEDGRLRELLMSRTPRKDQNASNGHGRSGLVGWARGRPGNLVLEARGGLAPRALRQRLLRAAHEEGLDHALIVTELEMRAGASSGQVVPRPHMVYRIGKDGSEELVRGASFGTLSIRDLRDVIATGQRAHAYHYALPSGGGFAIPSSVIAPDMIFESVELRRPTEPNRRLPIVSPPPLAAP
jgi:TldD protein